MVLDESGFGLKVVLDKKSKSKGKDSSKSNGRSKSKGDEAQQPRQRVLRVRKREGTSRETVGHEQTKTGQLTR